VPGQCDVLVQCELEELVAESILLVRRESSPVLDSKLPGLNGSQLTEVGPGVSAKDLQESIKRGGRTVVVLVQRSRGILDNLGVGCTVLDWRGRWVEAGRKTYAAEGSRAARQTVARPWRCLYSRTNVRSRPRRRSVAEQRKIRVFDS
jgi:hypothetical protein